MKSQHITYAAAQRKKDKSNDMRFLRQKYRVDTRNFDQPDKKQDSHKNATGGSTEKEASKKSLGGRKKSTVGQASTAKGASILDQMTNKAAMDQ